jgi:hypothetical protein
LAVTTPISASIPGCLGGSPEWSRRSADLADVYDIIDVE